MTQVNIMCRMTTLQLLWNTKSSLVFCLADEESSHSSSPMQRSVSERSRERGASCGASSSSLLRGSSGTTNCVSETTVGRHQRPKPPSYSLVQSSPNVSTVQECGGSSTLTRPSRKKNAAQYNNNNVSAADLADNLAILPIFQKLLSERHRNRGYSIASCPNISIKCDIVEYL
jgi:gamma-aminobutyric acid type B receptor